MLAIVPKKDLMLRVHRYTDKGTVLTRTLLSMTILIVQKADICSAMLAFFNTLSILRIRLNEQKNTVLTKIY